MYKRIALLLVLVNSSMNAIEFYDSWLAREYTGQMLLVLQDSQESDLLVLPSDVRQNIVSIMLLSIKEKEKLSDAHMQEIFLQ